MALPIWAQDLETYDPFEADETLKEIKAKISAEGVDSKSLNDARAIVSGEKIRADACEAEATEERARIEARFKPLRPIDSEVATAVFEQYLELKDSLDKAIGLQSHCAGIGDAAERLIAEISDLQSAISQQFLSNRSESVIGAIGALPGRLLSMPRELKESVDLALIPGITPLLLFWVLIAAGALAALLGVFIRHQFNIRYEQAGGDAADPQFKFLFPKPLADHAPLLLEGIALAAILLMTVQEASADLTVVRLAVGITMYGIGRVIIDWATGPLSPSASVKGLIPDHVKPLRRRLSVFLFMLVASFVVLGTRWLAIRTVAPDITGRATMIFLVAVSLLYLLAYLGKIPGIVGRFRLIRYLGSLTLIVGLVVLAVGYHNFAGYLVHGVIRTALALFLLWVVLWCVLELFEYLINQDTPSAVQIRHNLGMTDRATRTGLGFIQLVIDLVVWIGFVVFLLYVWDDSGTTLDSLYEHMISGVELGQIKLVPLDIVRGILLFVAMIIVIGWMKIWIDRRWLQQLMLERGAREALITIFGYVGLIVAVLIGLTQAGVDLGGLAFASAALALGIGFGMQEIANNFVSGLILLFERPIRTGDFVSVGDTEGFVRSIRIRATEIETMDNQHVMVPNSELISGRVTNWVLRNTAGRLQIKVGVAYGSDVEKVRDILESVAREHSEVITDGSAPAPRALFMGFGDSSLDFELRVRIFRIDRRFTVQSDINFAIDAAFRIQGISIPFPQRDLRVISYPAETTVEDKTAPVPEVPKDETINTRVLPAIDNITRTHTEKTDLAIDLNATWAAITDIDLLKLWFAVDGEFTAGIGGAFSLLLRDTTHFAGRIDIFIPNRRLRMVMALREGENQLPTGPITVELQLRQIESGTTLIVNVSGIPADEDWEEDYKRSEVRWQTALEELRTLAKNTT